MEPTLLSPTLLDELVAAMRRLGAPIVDNLAPGLSDTEIDRLLQPLGIDLPEEARKWWRWADGTRDDSPDAAKQFGIHHLPSLAREARYVRERASHDPDGPFSKLLQPIQDGGPPWVFLDCGVERDAPVPVLSQIDIEDPEPLLPSFGALVVKWIELMDGGYTTVDADGIWYVHPAGWPEQTICFGL